MGKIGRKWNMLAHIRTNSQASSGNAVVITGASSGIGEARALHLDRKGFKVFACVRKRGDGVSLRNSASGGLTPLMVDVTDPESIEQAGLVAAQAIFRNGAMLSLINNAGVVLGGPLEFLSPEDLRREMEVNLIGVVTLKGSVNSNYEKNRIERDVARIIGVKDGKVLLTEKLTERHSQKRRK